ncbi:zinc carboxypeptidase, partial [Pseudoalteromonas ruthenica]
KQDFSADGKSFKAGSAYVIPTNQKQFKIIKTVFEKTFEYKDSLFYDVTAWTMPLAFGLPYAEVKAGSPSVGDRVEKIALLGLHTHHLNNAYAYAIRWNEYYAP